MGIVLSLCCSFLFYLFADKDLQILVKNGFNSMKKTTMSALRIQKN